MTLDYAVIESVMKNLFMPKIRTTLDRILNYDGLKRRQILDIERLTDEQVMELWREVRVPGDE